MATHTEVVETSRNILHLFCDRFILLLDSISLSFLQSCWYYFKCWRNPRFGLHWLVWLIHWWWRRNHPKLQPSCILFLGWWRSNHQKHSSKEFENSKPWDAFFHRYMVRFLLRHLRNQRSSWSLPPRNDHRVWLRRFILQTLVFTTLLWIRWTRKHQLWIKSSHEKKTYHYWMWCFYGRIYQNDVCFRSHFDGDKWRS